MARLITLFLFAIVLACTLVQAKTLYVDASTGSDSYTYAQNDAVHPWRNLKRATMGNANAYYNPDEGTVGAVPAEAAQPGDVVIVRFGRYTTIGTNSRNVPAFNPINSGTAENPITFRAEGTVDFQFTSGIGPTFGASGRDYITWEGFSVDEALAPGAPDESAVVIWDSTGVVIRNCTIDGNGNPGSGALHAGIFMASAVDATVQNNYIHAVRTLSDFDANAACIIVVDAWGTNIIEHNELTDCNAGFFIKRSHATGQGKWHLRYNYIHDNSYGIRTDQLGNDALSESVDIYQNIFENNAIGVKIHYYENYPTRYVRYVNNVIIGSTDQAINFAALTPDAGHVFWNNIVSGGPLAMLTYDYRASFTQSTYDAEHNIYHGLTNFAFTGFEHYPEEGTTTYLQWQGLGQDSAVPASQQTNPLFVNTENGDYKLQPGSPARTLGVDILDLDSDGSTTDIIPAGAYITGNEVIGRMTSSSPPPPDTTPPTQVTGLTATTISSSQINLEWTAAIDVVGVTGYRVYRSGVNIANTTQTSYSDNGLTVSTTYTYTVAAYDAAGNLGQQSNSASATTSSPATTSLFFDDFEYDVARDTLDKNSIFTTQGGWQYVKSEPAQGGANGYTYTVTSIPGFAGPFPGNGSRVLALEARPIEGGFQTDFYLQYGSGEGPIGQIPADHWVQFWIYSEHTQEHPSLFTPQSKFLYYNRASYYPATISNNGSVFLVGLIHGSGPMLFSDPCPEMPAEEFVCEQGFFFARFHNGDGAYVNNNVNYMNDSLGPNLVSGAHVLPNQWTLVKMHFDTSGTDPRADPGQAVYEQWIRRPGDAEWTKTTEYIGGVTMTNGQELVFYPRFTDGFRMLRIPTTVGSSTYPNDPRDNTREYWVYVDDFTLGRHESELPTYGFSNPLPAIPGDVDGNRIVNLADLQLIINSFGRTTGQAGYSLQYDLAAHIGRIDLFDMMVVVRNWR